GAMGEPARTIPELLDTREVATLRRCTPNAIVQAVRRGKGPRVYGRGARGLLLFTAEDVDAWIRGGDDEAQVSGGDVARAGLVPDPSGGDRPEDGALARDRSQGAREERRRRGDDPRERARRMAEQAGSKRRRRPPTSR